MNERVPRKPIGIRNASSTDIKGKCASLADERKSYDGLKNCRQKNGQNQNSWFSWINWIFPRFWKKKRRFEENDKNQ